MQPTKLTEAFIRKLVYDDKPVVVRDNGRFAGYSGAVPGLARDHNLACDSCTECGHAAKVDTAGE
jgi:hypothetical protein